jgi:hypothetical protein
MEDLKMSALRNSSRFLIAFCALSAIGGFLAGSSRGQVKEAEQAGEVGRFQLFRTQTPREIDYVVFDTKTGCSYERDLDYIDENGAWIYWKRTPSPLDAKQLMTISERVMRPDETPDAKSESN